MAGASTDSGGRLPSTDPGGRRFGQMPTTGTYLTGSSTSPPDPGGASLLHRACVGAGFAGLAVPIGLARHVMVPCLGRCCSPWASTALSGGLSCRAWPGTKLVWLSRAWARAVGPPIWTSIPGAQLGQRWRMEAACPRRRLRWGWRWRPWPQRQCSARRCRARSRRRRWWVARLGMKTDGNGRENTSTISISVFYYGKQERERNRQERERKQDIQFTEIGGNRKFYRNVLLFNHHALFMNITIDTPLHKLFFKNMINISCFLSEVHVLMLRNMY